MRTLFLILLILLLPVRGWSAERMAVYMASGAAVSAMPDDCPMKLQAADADKDATHADQKSDRTCQACQLCMSWASQTTPVLKAPATETLSHTLPPADRFASVDLPRLAKPPIY